MAEYIDRVELVGNLDKFAPEHFTPLLRSLIEKQPTADVVEVVRCKKCKSFVERENAPDFCSKRRKWTNENDFCSNGERKEDNDKVR